MKRLFLVLILISAVGVLQAGDAARVRDIFNNTTGDKVAEIHKRGAYLENYHYYKDHPPSGFSYIYGSNLMNNANRHVGALLESFKQYVRFLGNVAVVEFLLRKIEPTDWSYAKLIAEDMDGKTGVLNALFGHTGEFFEPSYGHLFAPDYAAAPVVVEEAKPVVISTTDEPGKSIDMLAATLSQADRMRELHAMATSMVFVPFSKVAADNKDVVKRLRLGLRHKRVSKRSLQGRYKTVLLDSGNVDNVAVTEALLVALSLSGYVDILKANFDNKKQQLKQYFLVEDGDMVE